MYYEYTPQYPISQQVSLDWNFISLSPVLHVGGEGHSMALQSTAFASVQVHLWQLAVHMSPGYRYKPSLDFYSNTRMTINLNQSREKLYLQISLLPVDHGKLLIWNDKCQLHLIKHNHMLFVDNRQVANTVINTKISETKNYKGSYGALR